MNRQQAVLGARKGDPGDKRGPVVRTLLSHRTALAGSRCRCHALRLWILGSFAIVTGCGNERTHADPGTVSGTYVSVSESQCNVELALRVDGSAVVSNTCRLEDGTHRDSVVAAAATWKVTDGVVRVEYEGASHLLDFDAALSYGDFGGTGAGAGLKPRKQSATAAAAILRYGHLWKQPLPKS
jgi:hypothetical protein